MARVAPAIGVRGPSANNRFRCSMEFDVIGGITGAQTIATGSGIRELGRLRKRYGRGRWRKRKGFAEIRLPSGEILQAELHWYEATGIGKREMKIKAFI
jgi:hypothetical protein